MIVSLYLSLYNYQFSYSLVPLCVTILPCGYSNCPQLPALEVLPPAGWAHRNTGNITPGAKEWNDTKGPSKKEGTKSDWDLLVMKCHEIHLTGKHTWVGCQPCTNGRFMTLCFHTTGITCYFSLLTCKLKRSCRDSKEMVDHINLPAYFTALGVLVHILYICLVMLR